ncbi:hypothetical protein IAU60_006297 [Kwoniella sp. DSM 27419]
MRFHGLAALDDTATIGSQIPGESTARTSESLELAQKRFEAVFDQLSSRIANLHPQESIDLRTLVRLIDQLNGTDENEYKAALERVSQRSSSYPYDAVGLEDDSTIRERQVWALLEYIASANSNFRADNTHVDLKVKLRHLDLLTSVQVMSGTDQDSYNEERCRVAEQTTVAGESDDDVLVPVALWGVAISNRAMGEAWEDNGKVCEINGVRT